LIKTIAWLAPACDKRSQSKKFTVAAVQFWLMVKKMVNLGNKIHAQHKPAMKRYELCNGNRTIWKKWSGIIVAV
jgi:hypothetical protein